MGKIKQRVKNNAKANAKVIRENKWISTCVIILAISAVAVTLLLLRPLDEQIPLPPEDTAAVTEAFPTSLPSAAAEAVPNLETPEVPSSTNAPPATTPTPVITPPAASGSPVSDSNIVLNPVPPPIDIDLT